MALIGQVNGEPNSVMVSTVDGKALVTVWVGLDSTDLTPEETRQLARILDRAADEAR